MTKKPMNAVAGEASPVAIAIDQEDSEMTEDIQLPDGAISDETRKAQSDQQITSQYRENLAHNMRRFRAREGWTQTDLGRAIGSSQARLRNADKACSGIQCRTYGPNQPA
jgi:ribosome-binding protein aMBF1 (putative translation factor)